jgi:histidinol-phosphate aminotransferase
MTDPASLIRPLVRELHAYVPGEQPKIKRLIKLNTNENPYPPSPKVLKAIRSATDSRLRLYPNPTAERLRVKLAKFHRCAPENIIVGNGSDELLALAVRAFVEPTVDAADQSRSTVQYFEPSYSLYPVLADIHGARKNVTKLAAEFDLPPGPELRRMQTWDFNAALTFITSPNAPSGRGYGTSALEALCKAQAGVVVIDEAYVDFAEEHALELALRLPHVLVSRTFSKAYSLCFLRVGYFVGNPVLISALQKIRDSYNVNGVGQVAAEATLEDLAYYRENFRGIKQTRRRVTEELSALGFSVLPSQTNFILAQPPMMKAEQWLQALRDDKILVRWFGDPTVRDYLRITIGTDKEADALIRAAKKILRGREVRSKLKLGLQR